MEIVATTSLPAVDRPNADRWNAACSRQFNKVSKVDAATLVWGRLSGGRLSGLTFVQMKKS